MLRLFEHSVKIPLWKNTEVLSCIKLRYKKSRNENIINTPF